MLCVDKQGGPIEIKINSGGLGSAIGERCAIMQGGTLSRCYSQPKWALSCENRGVIHREHDYFRDSLRLVSFYGR